MRRLFLVTILMICHVNAISHMDKSVSFTKNGVLVGLPKQYQPALLDLKKKILTIGKTTMAVPKCLRKYFPSAKTHQVHIAASWHRYLYTRRVTPYIIILFRSIDGKTAYRHEYNLDTLEPIDVKIEKYIKRKDGAVTVHSERLVLNDKCIDRWRNSYTRKP